MKSSVNQPVSAVPSTSRVVRSAGELGPCRDIRRARDLVLVAQHEHAVARRDDVGLDRVGAERERQLVGRAGVLGTVAGRTAMADDERSARRNRAACAQRSQRRGTNRGNPTETRGVVPHNTGRLVARRGCRIRRPIARTDDSRKQRNPWLSTIPHSRGTPPSRSREPWPAAQDLSAQQLQEMYNQPATPPAGETMADRHDDPEDRRRLRAAARGRRHRLGHHAVAAVPLDRRRHRRLRARAREHLQEGAVARAGPRLRAARRASSSAASRRGTRRPSAAASSRRPSSPRSWWSA